MKGNQKQREVATHKGTANKDESGRYIHRSNRTPAVALQESIRDLPHVIWCGVTTVAYSPFGHLESLASGKLNVVGAEFCRDMRYQRTVP